MAKQVETNFARYHIDKTTKTYVKGQKQSMVGSVINLQKWLIYKDSPEKGGSSGLAWGIKALGIKA